MPLFRNDLDFAVQRGQHPMRIAAMPSQGADKFDIARHGFIRRSQERDQRFKRNPRHPDRPFCFCRSMSRKMNDQAPRDLTGSRLSGDSVEIENSVLDDHTAGKAAEPEVFVISLVDGERGAGLAGRGQQLQQLADRGPVALRDQRVDIQLRRFDFRGDQGFGRPIPHRAGQAEVAVFHVKGQLFDVRAIPGEL